MSENGVHAYGTYLVLNKSYQFIGWNSIMNFSSHAIRSSKKKWILLKILGK